MTNMTPASQTPAIKPKPRPRPQVMKLTDAAAERIAELTKRVKESFDPRGIFNPGRVYRGV